LLLICREGVIMVAIDIKLLQIHQVPRDNLMRFVGWMGVESDEDLVKVGGMPLVLAWEELL
jgi:hypothetical protein